MLEWGDKGFLGMGKRRTLVRDPLPEQQVRRRLAAVLSGAAAPTVQDAALLSVLQGLDIAANILRDESGGMKKKDLKHRIEQICADLPVNDALAAAIRDWNTVLMAAVVLPTTVASPGN